MNYWGEKMTEKKHVRPTNFTVNVPLCSLSAEADKYEHTFGKTELYSTGNEIWDEWLGGGFGKEGSYELVIVFGDSGVGKSTVAMQMMKESVIKGVPQAWMVLEDSLVDTNLRFRKMFTSKEEADKAISQEIKLDNGMTIQSPVLMSREVVSDEYNLDDLYDWIKLRIDMGIHLFLFDHLQFAFDNSQEVTEIKTNERQRKFLKRIEDLMVATSSTIVIVSHTNKDKSMSGMDRIYGASAIKQTATKVLEVARVSSGKGDNIVYNPAYVRMYCHKNRHVKIDPNGIGSKWLYLKRDPVGFGFSGATTVLTASMEDGYEINA